MATRRTDFGTEIELPRYGWMLWGLMEKAHSQQSFRENNGQARCEGTLFVFQSVYAAIKELDSL